VEVKLHSIFTSLDGDDMTASDSSYLTPEKKCPICPIQVSKMKIKRDDILTCSPFLGFCIQLNPVQVPLFVCHQYWLSRVKCKSGGIHWGAIIGLDSTYI
jgi:hypothetical protein